MQISAYGILCVSPPALSGRVGVTVAINGATAKTLGWSPDRETRIFARFLHPDALELQAETLEPLGLRVQLESLVVLVPLDLLVVTAAQGLLALRGRLVLVAVTVAQGQLALLARLGLQV